MARKRPTASDVPQYAAVPGTVLASLAPAQISDQELAAIAFRAAAIGVPAWRVATALGMPSPPASALDERAGEVRQHAGDHGVI